MLFHSENNNKNLREKKTSCVTRYRIDFHLFIFNSGTPKRSFLNANKEIWTYTNRIWKRNIHQQNREQEKWCETRETIIKSIRRRRWSQWVSCWMVTMPASTIQLADDRLCHPLKIFVAWIMKIDLIEAKKKINISIPNKSIMNQINLKWLFEKKIE